MPSRSITRGEVRRFDHLTLQWFDFSICDTVTGKKYFYVRPLVFNVPNKAMIMWFVTQFNVVKFIYISKVVGVEIWPQYRACLVEIWGRNPWLLSIGHSQTHIVQGGLSTHIYSHSVDFWNVDTYQQRFEFWYNHFQLLIVFGGVLLQIASK